MRRFINVMALLLTCTPMLLADVHTDKAMSKISRDTNNYISADHRASTEEEAYNASLQDLSAQIQNYMEERYGSAPDAVYLNGMSSIYQRLSNHISDNRYRVMLYVKKSDLKPMSGTDGSVVLALNQDAMYEPIPTSKPEPVVLTDTVMIERVIEVPLNPTVSQLLTHKTKDTIVEALTKMRKEKKISNTAAFPISSLNDFYVIIISAAGQVEAIAHVKEGEWTDTATGHAINPQNYPNCTAYWFTL